MNTMHDVAQAVREKEVHQEMSRLHGLLGDAQGAANNLCEALSAVLRPEGPTAVGTGDKSAPSICPLAEQLRSASENLQRTVAVITIDAEPARSVTHALVVSYREIDLWT